MASLLAAALWLLAAPSWPVPVPAEPESIRLPLRDVPRRAPSRLEGAAVLEGRVTSASDVRERVPYASVWLHDTRIGALTDADGGFRLIHLPAGARTVRVRALGYEPESLRVDLRDGETTHVEVALVGAGQARVVWSPPPPALLERLGRAASVEVFRLDARRWVRDGPPGRRRVVFEHPIGARASDGTCGARLAALLADSSHWARGLAGVTSEGVPMVALRLRSGRDVLDVELRPDTGVARLAANGRAACVAAFTPVRDEVVRLCRAAFPDDAELAAIESDAARGIR